MLRRGRPRRGGAAGALRQQQHRGPGTHARSRRGRRLAARGERGADAAGRQGPARRADPARPRVALHDAVRRSEGAVTDDHVRVERALSMTSGQAPKSETGSEMACRTRRVLESLAGLLETYSYRDEPMTLLFFSTGLAGPRRDAPATLAPGMCELNKDKFELVGADAARARANVYRHPGRRRRDAERRRARTSPASASPDRTIRSRGWRISRGSPAASGCSWPRARTRSAACCSRAPLTTSPRSSRRPPIATAGFTGSTCASTRPGVVARARPGISFRKGRGAPLHDDAGQRA